MREFKVNIINCISILSRMKSRKGSKIFVFIFENFKRDLNPYRPVRELLRKFEKNLAIQICFNP